MAKSQAPFTPDDLGACAATAMAEIRIVLSRLTPAERAAFWNAVDLLYRAPSGSPMSMKESRPVQNGVAQGLKALLPPLWKHAGEADGCTSLPELQACEATG
ncbi:hypothetical protein J2X36_001442 [Methylobacterium sp. BE186]|uniref:hypothetical protein n=1 Tax=Methylobacterium sp. BE186 TaxID=2817715 RepID=UPI002857ECAC|nr:hypothetical protein [Methylobacterium sp. BE186]MDR7036701.1 hypothetical protein [Methylobacterium sp. BE186]